MRKQRDAQRQSLSPNRANGLPGENLEHRELTWRDLWEMEESRINFIMRATYDVLPTTKNPSQWVGEDPSYAFRQTPASLRQNLIGCKTSLTQGRYTWRHNQVLRQLVIILERS